MTLTEPQPSSSLPGSRSRRRPSRPTTVSSNDKIPLQQDADITSDTCSSCSTEASTASSTASFASDTRITATTGDIVAIDLNLRPEHGYIPENLFDTSGRISFVLGWGNYLPALHELVKGMQVGDSISKVSIDAGFGRHHPELVIEVPKTNLEKMQNINKIAVGSTLNLRNGTLKVQVIKVDQDTIVVDANHPLAGSSYECSLEVVSIDRLPTSKMEYHKEDDGSSENSPFEMATFAMGCFWGIELAMMRVSGVVGTRVGYTQGIVSEPSYRDVCKGTTKHREAVMVVYDTRVVAYQDLLTVYAQRLAATESSPLVNLFQEESDDIDEDHDGSLQYKNGVYFHNAEQWKIARTFLNDHCNRYDVELLQATVFYVAEESHQQYLYKGGQTSRKNAREPIRCFG